eukprot:g142.t1
MQGFGVFHDVQLDTDNSPDRYRCSEGEGELGISHSNLFLTNKGDSYNLKSYRKASWNAPDTAE